MVVELDQAVRGQLRMPRGALIVNAVPERRFSLAEAEQLSQLGAAGDARAHDEGVRHLDEKARFWVEEDVGQ